MRFRPTFDSLDQRQLMTVNASISLVIPVTDGSSFKAYIIPAGTTLPAGVTQIGTIDLSSTDNTDSTVSGHATLDYTDPSEAYEVTGDLGITVNANTAFGSTLNGSATGDMLVVAPPDWSYAIPIVGTILATASPEYPMPGDGGSIIPETGWYQGGTPPTPDPFHIHIPFQTKSSLEGTMQHTIQ